MIGSKISPHFLDQSEGRKSQVNRDLLTRDFPRFAPTARKKNWLKNRLWFAQFIGPVTAISQKNIKELKQVKL